MNIGAKITAMTSREFNQNTAKAKRATRQGPVFITDRGKPSHVLLSKDEFDRLAGNTDERKKSSKSLAEALAHPESAHIKFDIPEFKNTFKGFEFD